MWTEGIAGLLIDVTGVLYNSGPGGGTVIDGSLDAIQQLKDNAVPFKLCSNESTQTREDFAQKLIRHGFNITAQDIYCPPPCLASILKERNLRPFLVVHPDVLPEFEGIDCSEPNCVVLGDAQEHFEYEKLNSAFRILLEMKEKKLFSAGAGKYYSEGGQLVLDVGSYAKMMEYATGAVMEVVGKPSPVFFSQALKLTGLQASQCAMIGDDIISDVGGAQKCGIKGIQVRTGKHRPEDEPHPTVTPDAYVDNLAAAVKQLLEQQNLNWVSFRHVT